MGHWTRAISARTAVLLVIAGIVVFTCLCGTASATKVHVYSHSFGTGLSLISQSGIAIDEETGEAYIADTQHSRIAKFTAAGAADGGIPGISSPTFIAVDNSAGPSKGDIYVVEDEKTVTKFDPAGALVTGWGTGGQLTETEEILGVAVGPGGNLWVATGTVNVGPGSHYEGATLSGKEFDQAGAPLRSWLHTYDPFAFTLGLRAGIAVDSADNLYARLGAANGGVAEAFPFLVSKFSSSGEQLLGLSEKGDGLAVDPSSDELYVGNLQGSPNLGRFSPNSTTFNELERFGGNLEGPIERSGSAKDGLEGIASIAATKDGSVYVLDPKNGKAAAFDLEEVEPPTVSIEPPDSIAQTSAHVVGHINPNASAGSWPSHDVAWTFKCLPRCPGHEGFRESEGGGYIEADGQGHTVEVTLEGLKAGWEYSVWLFAKNRGGEFETTKESFPTAPLAPGVEDEFATEVHSGEATLNAAINPNGSTTTYQFEYVTKAAFEAEGFGGAQTHVTPESEPIAPLHPDPLHPENVPPTPQVKARISGLEPATDYVYRAVATNSVSTTNGDPSFFRSQVGEHALETDCPNQALRTDAGARLPDCRAYELASPAEKGGSLVEPFSTWLQTSPDGSSITWYSGKAASGVPGSGEGGHQDVALYLSSLAAEGWSSQRLLPPGSLGELGGFLGLSTDGHFAMLEGAERGGVSPALYLLDTVNRSLSTIVPPQVGQTPPGEKRAFTFDGTSEDDSLFFFESPLQLTSKAAAGKDNFYLWNRQTEALSLVGVLPGAKAEAPAGGSFGGSYAWVGGDHLNIGGSRAGLYVGALHAISKNGDRAYFTAGETGQIYLRSGLTGATPSTVRVSVANASVHDANGQKPAVFREATPDGGRVFFTSPGKLTTDANTGSADEGSDLYRYDAEAKKLIDVTPLPGGAGARVQGLLGTAEDGASGYLAAKGVLAEGGVEGENNIYHFEEGPGGAFSLEFVAALSEGTGNWSPTAGVDVAGGEPYDVAKTARVSADGGTLLFMSRQQLDGGPQGECPFGLCTQAYRYSIAEEALACISCNPSTAAGAPVIGAELSPSTSTVILLPESFPAYGILPRNLSPSGTRVFFQTSESLLPEDKNGQNCTDPYHCIDVYEWEAVGTGSCQAAEANGGCLYLISSGESGESSYFLDASTSGDSAFFITDSQLLPADKDELSDVYDARVDGGLASQHVVPTESCRSAEACAGAGSSPPPPQSAGTQSFQGPGNSPVTRCKPGSSRKHAKCVKHKAKKRHKKKSRATGTKHSGGAK